MNKKYWTLLVLLLTSFAQQKMFAQVKAAPPDGIIFQAIATDPQGNPAAGATINVKDALLQNSANGTVVFSESFQVTASASGVFTIVIGKGDVSSGPTSIENLDWSAGPYFLNIKAAISPSTNYVDMGTSQFWSVPYAFHAGSVAGLNFPSSNGTNGQVLTTDGHGTLRWTTPQSFVLPIAGTSVLGGVKIGPTMSIDANGVLNTIAGVTGPTGPQGIQGATGATGPTGPIGPRGLQGATGATGPTGPTGVTGPTGPQGIQGATGATGAQGPQGIQGPMGPQGATGPAGAGSVIAVTAGTGLTGGTISTTGTINADTTVLQTVNNLFPKTDSRYLQLTGGTLTGALTGTTINTTGTIKVGTVTYPNTDGTSGQVLTTNGSGTLNWATVEGSNITIDTKTQTNPFDFASPYVGGALDVTTAQNLGNGLNVLTANSSGIANLGLGINVLSTNTTGAANTAVGFNVLKNNISGNNNTALGTYALFSNTTGGFNTALGSTALISNTTGINNTAIGEQTLIANTTGRGNISIGASSSLSNTTGIQNTVIGTTAFVNNTTGSQNVAIGKSTGIANQTGSQNTMIGMGADVSTDGITNATAIGYAAIVNSNNTIQLGNNAITNVNTSGTITAGAVTYPNTDGTSGQVLTTNGSGALSWATPPTGATGATGAQGPQGIQGPMGPQGATGPAGAGSVIAVTAGTGLTGGTISTTGTINADTTVLQTVNNLFPKTDSRYLQLTGGTLTGALTGTSITGSSIVKSGGTATQFLKADGSVDTSAYLTAAVSSITAGTGLTGGTISSTGTINADTTVLQTVNNLFPKTDSRYLQLTGGTLTGALTGTSITGSSIVKSGGTATQFLKADGSVDTSAYLTAAVSSITAGTGLTGGTISTTGTINADTTVLQTVNNLFPLADSRYLTKSDANRNYISVAGGAITGSLFIYNGAFEYGGVYYPNTDGASGQVLTTNGHGTASWANTNGIPYTGATGPVNLGNYNLTVNGLTVGQGSGFSTLLGANVQSDGIYSLAIGSNATTGTSNYSMAIGGNHATAGGDRATAVGAYTNAAYTQSTTLGSFTYAGGINSMALGYGAQALSDNTIQLGNSSITNVNTSGTITAGKVTYPNTDGTNGQLLATNGSGSLTWVTPLAAGTGTVTAVTAGTGLTGGTISSTGTINADTTVLQTVNNLFPLADSRYLKKSAVINTYLPLTGGTLTGALTGTTINTTGTIKVGAITYPNTDGASGQVLTTNGNGTASWANTNGIPYTGATGPVNLGNYNLTVNGLTVGQGSGFSTLLGANVQSDGIYSLAIGSNATTGTSNYSMAIGGNHATAGGDRATAVGAYTNAAYTQSTTLGSFTYAGGINSMALGYGAQAFSANTIQLGNTNITMVNTSGDITAMGTDLLSDRRLKTNIVPITNGLASIMQLNPVHYNKKSSLASTDYNKTENGFIAQEIRKVLPFVVKEGIDKNKILSVDYTSIIPLLTKGIQEQQKQIEQQDQQNQAQQKQIDAQQKQIDELKATLTQLIKEKVNK